MVFVDWLSEREEGRKVLPGFLLQTFCGLRSTEALRIEWSDLDLINGFVTIEGEVKCHYSCRRIPLPQYVLHWLRVIPQSSERILPDFVGEYDFHIYNAAFKELLSEWDRDKEFTKITSRWLRKTLEAEADFRGWEGHAFNRYMGRAPQNVQQKHYQRKAIPESQLQEMFRAQVVDKVDKVLNDCLENLNTKFEPANVIALRPST
ncbi:MAG: site-specific integrase [Candidatus Omnitrophica bacterium]|nr:site-specific integrase [Candidatus Omnitrophota bacterium]